MYTFRFTYSDNSYRDYDNIIRVEYSVPFLDDVILTEESFLSHRFPLNHDMHLYAENKNYTVICKNLVSIEVTKVP